jgi:hypothetical protein
MQDILLYEVYYSTLAVGISELMIRTSENFRRALVPHSFLDLVAPIWRIWRSGLPGLTCCCTKWGQLTNRIWKIQAVCSTAMFKYANQKRGRCKQSDVAKLQNLKEDVKRSGIRRLGGLESLERERFRILVYGKAGREF